MTPLVQALIIANVAAFLLEPLSAQLIVGWFALWPPGSGRFMPWQVLSYAFLHANTMHLAFNMFGLWMFGTELNAFGDPGALRSFSR